MIETIAKESVLPFTGDGIDLPSQGFIDRETFKNTFAMKVGCERTKNADGTETWKRKREDGCTLEDWAWIVEGRRGFGKSAFASWCYEMQFAVEPRGHFYVALANPDLCANPRIGPLEAALHRLRGEVLEHLQRADDGLEFGWWSPGEVLRAICDEAAEKAPVSPDGRPLLRSIVFILDNVSILPRDEGEGHYQDRKGLGSVEREVAALIAEVSRLGGRSGHRKPRPKVGVLILAYPGFSDRVGYALRSRFVRCDQLTIFENNHLKEFDKIYLHDAMAKSEVASPSTAQTRVNPKPTGTETAIQALYRLSGGIPDLVQILAKRTMARVSNDAELSAESLIAAARVEDPEGGDAELLSHLKEQIRDRGIVSGGMKDNVKGLITALSLPDARHLSLSRLNPSPEGTLLDELSNLLTVSKDEISMILKELVRMGLLERDDDSSSYKMFADAVWLNWTVCVGKL